MHIAVSVSLIGQMQHVTCLYESIALVLLILIYCRLYSQVFPEWTFWTIKVTPIHMFSVTILHFPLKMIFYTRPSVSMYEACAYEALDWMSVAKHPAVTF